MPWEHSEWHNKNEEVVVKHVENYRDAQTGVRCFSNPCKSLIQIDSQNQDIKGLPWEHSAWHEKNEDIVVHHV